VFFHSEILDPDFQTPRYHLEFSIVSRCLRCPARQRLRAAGGGGGGGVAGAAGAYAAPRQRPSRRRRPPLRSPGRGPSSPCRVSVCLGLGPNSGSHLGQKCSVKFPRQISSNFFLGQLHWSLVSIRRVNRLVVQGSSFPHTGGHGVSPPLLPDRLMQIIAHFEGCLETRGGEGPPTHPHISPMSFPHPWPGFFKGVSPGSFESAKDREKNVKLLYEFFCGPLFLGPPVGDPDTQKNVELKKNTTRCKTQNEKNHRRKSGSFT